MKKTIALILILALLNFWMPCVNAGIYEELDPMVSPDASMTMADEDFSMQKTDARTSNVVGTADMERTWKKSGKSKTEKSRKSSKKKSSEKKRKKSSERARSHKKSSR